MRTYRIYFATCPSTKTLVSLKSVRHKLGDVGDPGPEMHIGVCPSCNKRHKAQRIIRRPMEPSNHECDARCLNAKGEHCQCKCGGENHGIGGLGINSIGMAL